MTTTVTFTPFEKREVRFLGLHDVVGTRLKVYGLGVRGAESIGAEWVSAALAQAERYLNGPSLQGHAGGVSWSELESHGVGVLTIHPGREAVFLLLDLWVGENMLRHHVWASDKQNATGFESLSPTDVSMCVWEMAVLQHERSAWLRHVLTERGEGDITEYLHDVFEGEL